MSPTDFPITRCSIIHATGSDDPHLRDQAWDGIVRSYWRPVYKYVRIRWSRGEADAADLTQEFFARAIDRGFFAGFDPARARFRTYLRMCLDRFLSNERKAGQRQKRGGGYQHVSLDFTEAEAELASTDPLDDAEAFFRRESLRSLFTLALDRVRADAEAEGRTSAYDVLERYDLRDPAAPPVTYRDVADELGLPVTTVTNHLSLMRRRLREAVLDELRAVSGSEREYIEEARDLLGTEPA
jgi:RNA polymerase sigma factor (sigma-70 family)